MRFPFLLRLPLPALALVLAASCSAATLTGTVTNGTTRKPAAGDDVVLIKLVEGMQEVGRTKVDRAGHFTLEFEDSAAPHLVRVTHQKVNYHARVTPGTTSVEIQVYDAAAKVEGITANVDIMRLQADQSSLQVVEMYALKNESSPPRTKMGDRPFEIYLPEGAQLDSSLAEGPGGMPVTSAPVPTGESNRYAFIFPLRPGETRFQIAYHLPYSGHASFDPRVLMPVQNLVIMMPKSMSFQSPEPAFQPAHEEAGMVVYLASAVKPGQKLPFKVSGTGAIPRETQEPGAAEAQNQAESARAAGAPPSSSENARPGGGLGPPEDKPDPLHKYRWYILGGTMLALAAGAYFIIGRQTTAPVNTANASRGLEASGQDWQSSSSSAIPRAIGVTPLGVTLSPDAATSHSPSNRSSLDHSSLLLSVLKEELFQLETERLQKRISEDEYAKARLALEQTLQRALARNS